MYSAICTELHFLFRSQNLDDVASGFFYDFWNWIICDLWEYFQYFIPNLMKYFHQIYCWLRIQLHEIFDANFKWGLFTFVKNDSAKLVQHTCAVQHGSLNTTVSWQYLTHCQKNFFYLLLNIWYINCTNILSWCNFKPRC